MNKIAVIGVYIGKLPSYFSLWLRSCEYNPTIDFLVFTDDKEVQQTPDNVKMIPITLSELKNRIEAKLNMAVSLEKPYKCCDFRPAYGLIFQEYLSQYDYWGHCDFDMIFGDLRYYFDQYELYQYDKFLNLGHLSLYKNTAECNSRYMLDGSKCGNYETVFSSPKNYAFDEDSGIYQIYIKQKFPVFAERIFADISEIYKRFRRALSDVNDDHQTFYWKSGKVFRAFYRDEAIEHEEFIYIHFKKRNFKKENFDASETELFFITPMGFMEGKADVALRDIERTNRFPGRLSEWAERKKYDLNKIKNKIKMRLKLL